MYVYAVAFTLLAAPAQGPAQVRGRARARTRDWSWARVRLRVSFDARVRAAHPSRTYFGLTLGRASALDTS